MLGETIEDPQNVESTASEARGLNMLPVRTVLRQDKIVRRVEAATPSGIRFQAYEIHMGETSRPPSARPFAVLSDGAEDGVRAERCAGTYLHGALECAAVLSELLGCPIPAQHPKQESYARLAEWFGQSARGFEELYL